MATVVTITETVSSSVTVAAQQYLMLLIVSGANPRYFINGSNSPVILAGSHTWNNHQDMGIDSPPPVFGYEDYLDYMITRGHNCMRYWAWEQTRWSSEVNNTSVYFAPHIYDRSGTAGHNDGGNKVDCDDFNQDYFDRLYSRVLAAKQHGIYCIVMFFNGWSIGYTEPWSPGYYQPFNGHPYNASNNVNSLDGDTNDDGHGKEVEYNTIAAITTYQKAYVAKVIDTLNGLDNILWEITNEGEEGEEGQDWQNEIVTYIQTYEATKPLQHLVGVNMVEPQVYTVGADWTSPNSIDPSMDDPTEYDGSDNPIIIDSDHNGGIVNGWNPFRHFCKGHGGIQYMDNYDGSAVGGGGTGSDDRATVVCEYTRYNLGYVLEYSTRMDLLNCTPQSALSSAGYCIRKADTHYLCYQPGSGDFTLNLTEASGTFTIEWLKCSDGTVSAGGTTTGGASRTLTPPGTDYVAFVYKA